MSVIAVCGLPGSGKSLFTTYLARKNYKILNKFNFGAKKNYIYSNYPIKLDNKHYSKSVSLDDLALKTSWQPGSTVILDEVQLYFDSLDFKDFPKNVRNTFQLHRHFGINNIYINSQHPSRIVKQLRVLCCEFYDIVGFVKIPFTPFALFRYNVYYNSDDFGKSVKVNKADVSYKFAKRFKFINYKKVYKSYDTCYMSELVSDKPKYDSDEFYSKTMTKDDINHTFNITDEVVEKRPKRSKKVVESDAPVSSSFQEENQKSSSEVDKQIISSKALDDTKPLGKADNDEFIHWSPVGSKPTDDVYSLIDDIEDNSNDNPSSFW